MFETSIPFVGRLIAGQQQTVGAGGVASFDFSAFAGQGGNALVLSSDNASATDGRTRVVINGASNATAFDTAPTFEAAGEFVVMPWRQNAVVFPFSGGNAIRTVGVGNPSAAAHVLSVALVSIDSPFVPLNFRPIASTQINLTSGVDGTIDWSGFAGDEFGDIVVLGTADGGGANATRIVHNSGGVALVAPGTMGLGAVVNLFSFYSVGAPAAGQNIKTTSLRQDSGGALTVIATKYRRA